MMVNGLIVYEFRPQWEIMCSKNGLLYLHVVRNEYGYAMSMFLCDGYDINDVKCRGICSISRRVVADVLGDMCSNLFLALIMKGNGLVCNLLKLGEGCRA